jgi:hypothetical protein
MSLKTSQDAVAPSSPAPQADGMSTAAARLFPSHATVPARHGLRRDDVTTAAEVAGLLHLPVSAVHHVAPIGQLPARRLGRTWRIVRPRLEETLGVWWLGADTDPQHVQIEPSPQFAPARLARRASGDGEKTSAKRRGRLGTTSLPAPSAWSVWRLLLVRFRYSSSETPTAARSRPAEMKNPDRTRTSARQPTASMSWCGEPSEVDPADGSRNPTALGCRPPSARAWNHIAHGRAIDASIPRASSLPFRTGRRRSARRPTAHGRAAPNRRATTTPRATNPTRSMPDVE